MEQAGVERMVRNSKIENGMQPQSPVATSQVRHPGADVDGASRAEVLAGHIMISYPSQSERDGGPLTVCLDAPEDLPAAWLTSNTTGCSLAESGQVLLHSAVRFPS